jgi:hypothetical protein
MQVADRPRQGWRARGGMRTRMVWLLVLALAMSVCVSACAIGATTQPTPLPGTSSPGVSSPGPGITPQAAHNSNITYGVDIDLHQRDVASNPAKVFQLAAAAGAQAVRTGMDWSMLEPSPGTYNWAPLDRFVSQDIVPNHLKLLFGIGNTPTWDLAPEANGDGSYPPADCLNGGTCQAAQTFAAALAQHLSTLLPDVYIIPRNEPQNTAKNWVGGTADEYAQFQHVIYAGAHSADPRAKVLNGGEEIWPSDYVSLVGKSRPLQFDQSLYTNTLFCDSIDILDLHVSHAGPTYSREIVDTSERALQQCNGGKQVPVWVTEVGLSSLSSTQQQPSYVSVLGSNYTQGDASQQRFMVDTFAALGKDPNVIGINWVYMVDASATTNPNEQGLGLVDVNYAPKPSFSVFQALATGRGG